jgi:hypothetical protein
MGNVERLQEARDQINGVWDTLVNNMTPDNVLKELNNALENIIFVQTDLENFYTKL